MEMGWLGRRQM